jgi:hypothetical protein
MNPLAKCLYDIEPDKIEASFKNGVLSGNSAQECGSTKAGEEGWLT